MSPLSLCQSEIQDLSDIMNHAVQDPLDIDLYFSSKRKSVQPFPILDIGKHGLDDRDPLVIDVSSPVGIYLLSHLFDEISGSGPDRNAEITPHDAIPLYTPIL